MFPPWAHTPTSTCSILLLQNVSWLSISAALWLAVAPAVATRVALPALQGVLGLLRTSSPWGRDNLALAALFFMAIGGWNMQALVPGALTVAAQLCVTGPLAVVFFVGYLAPRFARLGGYAGSFVVLPGMGPALGTMLIVIELVSVAARCLALAIRLCCNLLSGHVLLKCILGGWFAGLTFFCAEYTAVLQGGALWSACAVLVGGLIGAVMVLETAVAVLQAYVFTTLVLSL